MDVSDDLIKYFVDWDNLQEYLWCLEKDWQEDKKVGSTKISSLKYKIIN